MATPSSSTISQRSTTNWPFRFVNALLFFRILGCAALLCWSDWGGGGLCLAKVQCGCLFHAKWHMVITLRGGQVCRT